MSFAHKANENTEELGGEDGHPGVSRRGGVGQDQRDATLVIMVTGSQGERQYEYPEQGIKLTGILATPRQQIENPQITVSAGAEGD